MDGDSINALANLPPQLAMIRIENDTIQALAAAHPRNHQKIKESLLAQVDAYPAFAKEAIYDKPVGKDAATGVMQFARGLSIRAAEAIAEAYGFCRVRADVQMVDANTAKIEASFTDYQTGRIWQDSSLVSRNYKGRDGKIRQHNEDRFLNVVLTAAKSKVIREVILRSVPPGLRAELHEAIEARLAAVLDDKAMGKIGGAFASKGSAVERLEQLVGRTRKAGWTMKDRERLVGIWNALEAEETSLEELFGAAADTPQGAAETPSASLHELASKMASKAAAQAAKKPAPGNGSEAAKPAAPTPDAAAAASAAARSPTATAAEPKQTAAAPHQETLGLTDGEDSVEYARVRSLIQSCASVGALVKVARELAAGKKFAVSPEEAQRLGRLVAEREAALVS